MHRKDIVMGHVITVIVWYCDIITVQMTFCHMHFQPLWQE